MFKMSLVGVLAPVSSVLMLLGMIDHLHGDTAAFFFWGAIPTSLGMALALNWPKGDAYCVRVDAPLLLLAWPFVIGWRTWGKVLVTMGVQALSELVLLVIYPNRFRVDIDEAFLLSFLAVSVPTAFLFAALIFAPKAEEERDQPTRQSTSV